MDKIISKWENLTKYKFTLLITGLLISSLTVAAQTTANSIIGTWINQEKAARIEIYQQGKEFNGRIVWLKEPNEDGKPKTDNKNPDKTRHNDPVIGLVMLKGFEFDGRSSWKGGTIYDARSGKTYSCYLTLQADQTLKVRGYIGLSWFGQTNIWTKVN